MHSGIQNGTLLAAVDLGSNSYRLELGRYDHGQVHRIEYIKETLRQGDGLDGSRNLTPEAMQRGWDCLARFGERLTGLRRAQVRAVATQTLREARNRDEFLRRAQQVLGFPIDVISGREEARLIYLGVAHLLPQTDERRLVVDIGGRSTELILGCQFDAAVTESYRVGSAAWSAKYFPDGNFTAAAFESAEVAAKAVLDGALSAYRRDTWDTAYGASGTVGAVSDILRDAGWEGGRIDRDGLSWLREELLASRKVEKVRLEGLRDDRRAVIAGGLAVLRAVFDLLEIDQMEPALGGLRQGAVFDLLDREHVETDIRSTTVQRLAARFQADPVQAQRVGRVACRLLRQLRGHDIGTDLARHSRKLEWAAQLHEIGRALSHSDYHKHGAYILDNSDAPGFALPEMHRLGLLVLGHRGKLRKLDADFEDPSFVHQLLCLRLAVILCHARRDPDLKGLQARAVGRKVTIGVLPDWAKAFPQSAHLLREEVLAWQKTPWSLVLA
jgi:exopolyphosphatase / guanosine-5'-triphosphate,3'-diphosphate pyrophosphatase